jgi:hypothetical protein
MTTFHDCYVPTFVDSAPGGVRWASVRWRVISSPVEYGFWDGTPWLLIAVTFALGIAAALLLRRDEVITLEATDGPHAPRN